MNYQTQLLIVMITYMVLIILWGIYQGRKVKSSKDFAIAGRNLPGWVAALSERATGESSWALLGLPGAAYATGLTEIWTALGCVLGIIVAWWVLAWRLRDEADKYDIDTFTDYIAKRHNDTGKWIRITGSFTIVFFFFFYVGAQFIGGAKTLENLFGLNQILGMLIVFVLVIPYTIYGGFRSVTYTDVIQAIIMIITLIITPIVAIFYLKSLPDAEVFARSIPEALDMAGSSYSSITGGSGLKEGTPLFNSLSSIFPEMTDAVKGLGMGIIIFGSFSWFFGYLGGQPQLSMRFMAIGNPKQAKIGRNIGIIWTIIAYIGALMIGWVGIAMFGPKGISDAETILPEILTKVFPPLLAGILITGVIAAIISTANSILILSATELSDNLIKPFTKKKRTEKASLNTSRIITTLLAVVALFLAYFSYSPYKIDNSSIDNLKAQNIELSVINKLSSIEDQEFSTKIELSNALSGLLTADELEVTKQQIINSSKKGGTLIFTLVGYVWAGIGGTFSIVILFSLFWKRFHGRSALITIIVGMAFTIIWISTGMDKIITSRILTFFVAGFVAILTTYLIPKKETV